MAYVVYWEGKPMTFPSEQAFLEFSEYQRKLILRRLIKAKVKGQNLSRLAEDLVEVKRNPTWTLKNQDELLKKYILGKKQEAKDLCLKCEKYFKQSGRIKKLKSNERKKRKRMKHQKWI